MEQEIFMALVGWSLLTSGGAALSASEPDARWLGHLALPSTPLPGASPLLNSPAWYFSVTEIYSLPWALAQPISSLYTLLHLFSNCFIYFRERNINRFPPTPQLGIKPATCMWVWMENQTLQSTESHQPAPRPPPSLEFLVLCRVYMDLWVSFTPRHWRRWG